MQLCSQGCSVAPHQNGRLCAWTSVGLLPGSESVNVFLLLEGGMERVPVKSQGGQKLGGTLSGFGGTAAVLKDLACLEQRTGKNDSFFCKKAVHKDRCVAVLFSKNTQLGTYRFDGALAVLKLEKMYVDLWVCHLRVSRKVSSSESKVANESKKKGEKKKKYSCLKDAKALVACVNSCTENDAKILFPLLSHTVFTNLHKQKGSFGFLPSFVLMVFFFSQLDVSWHRFVVVALSSAVKVRDRWKDSVVACKYKLYSPNKQDAKQQQQQRKGCSCCGGSVSVDCDCVRPRPAASQGCLPAAVL
ncbi:uncharacterized protein LOC126039405 isoform X2 [Accipiter gentilis]|uniref:uncharacterized protein LOC126039405 isoform X2 n=1 Tax=Astur gentilis TaxID=8957 RepID=UPI002110AED1|nr:uncharacterized protein LOC126039405 isoform X2 [Accipiter gentilis]